MKATDEKMSGVNSSDTRGRAKAGAVGVSGLLREERESEFISNLFKGDSLAIDIMNGLKSYFETGKKDFVESCLGDYSERTLAAYAYDNNRDPVRIVKRLSENGVDTGVFICNVYRAHNDGRDDINRTAISKTFDFIISTRIENLQKQAEEMDALTG